jgi:hypothetical protein
MAVRLCGVVLVIVIWGWTLPCQGQAPQKYHLPTWDQPENTTTANDTSLAQTAAEVPTAQASSSQTSASRSSSLDQGSGTVSGTIVDRTGALVPGARVTLTRDGKALGQDALSSNDGQFAFTNVTTGSFQLAVTAAGFATQTSSGLLHAGESFVVPPIVLTVATAVTEVNVALSPVQVAEEEIKDEEKQRVFGVIPNFYVTYDHNAAPLDAKQKFKLAWRTTIDPVSFGIIGVIAGIQQSQNSFSGYGQGAQGYAKRYGASFADFVSGTFIGSAILPSVLKQDPRYFYKGTGSKRSRLLYALANAVICKGDNGRWQLNYSSIVGNMAAGGISNLYYPAENRNGAGLTVENGLIGIGATAAASVVQEFFMKKVTSNSPRDPAGSP